MSGEPDARMRQWQVSVSLPIEAPDRAAAAARFWEYVQSLGSDELPVFISPSGDELAMRAFVGGAETDLDPEPDD